MEANFEIYYKIKHTQPTPDSNYNLLHFYKSNNMYNMDDITTAPYIYLLPKVEKKG
jgi:hypothetical protein